jgi:hypothetical protein
MSRYLFREEYYRPDIRMKGKGGALPHGHRILTGQKYNDEEFLKIVRVPRECFHSLVWLLKDHHSFGKHGLRQRKQRNNGLFYLRENALAAARGTSQDLVH